MQKYFAAIQNEITSKQQKDFSNGKNCMNLSQLSQIDQHSLRNGFGNIQSVVKNNFPFDKFCKICQQIQNINNRLISPCKCDQLVHILCLQHQIQQRMTKSKQKFYLKKCIKCKQKYSFDIKFSYSINLSRIIQNPIKNIIHLIVLSISLLIIIGLSLFLTKMQSQQTNQQNQVNKNSNNSKNYIQKHLIEKIMEYLFLSVNQIRTLGILLLITFSVVFIFFVTYWVKKYLLVKKLTIQNYQETQKGDKQEIKRQNDNHFDCVVNTQHSIIQRQREILQTRREVLSR